MLKRLFENSMTEVYLLFLQSVLPTLTHANQYLQMEEPMIHLLKLQLMIFLKKIWKVSQTRHTINVL